MAAAMSNTPKTALVTGASRGLGAAIAECLAPDYHVVAVARTVGALEEVDDRIKARGGQATLAPMNITEEPAMATLCRGIHDRWGALDLWVHTAVHAAQLSPAHMTDAREMATSVDVNVTATMRLVRFVAPLLRTEGRAMFFDDPHAGDKFFGLYGATKAAQIAFVRSWQSETERTGPKVDIVTPPGMPTAARNRFFPGEDRSKLTLPMAAAQNILATHGIVSPQSA